MLFNDFLKSNAKPLGEITDYNIHAHNVIWIKTAPKFDHDSDEDVSNFIDKYVSCAIPDNECSKLKDLVLLLQQHKHSSYCKRGGTCRFNFPHPPSTKTLIAYPHTDDDDIIDLNTVSNALSKVCKELIDGNVDVSIEQLLNNAKVFVGHYEKALRTCCRGNA